MIPTIGIQSQVDEDDAARRFVIRQSHRDQWLGKLDGGDGGDGEEAPQHGLRDLDRDDEVLVGAGCNGGYGSCSAH